MNIARLEKRAHKRTWPGLARSYRIWVTPTLFGDYAVVREWGRIGSPGTVREAWYESEAEAVRDGCTSAPARSGAGISPLPRADRLPGRPCQTYLTFDVHRQSCYG